MAMSIQDLLVHSTVRIEAESENGDRWAGTGFYMHLLKFEDNVVPVIITNKHVTETALNIYLHMNFTKNNDLPDYGNHKQYCIKNVPELCVDHPNPNVDLSAILISPWLKKFEQQDGPKLCYYPLTVNIIPDEREREMLSSIEDILMIGYPDSTWDDVNNLPVVRKGISATHPHLYWKGNPEFLTDIASFSGSSGSPVYLYNPMGYMDHSNNSYIMGERIKLLGIHRAGALHQLPSATIQIPNNVGVAINSNEILVLEEEVRRRVSV
ncbi:MAG: hypothetical protein ACTH7L_09415 [Psychrobacter alimentarius]